MIFETVCVGALEVNCYILAAAKNRQAMIIDPGDEADRIRRVLDKYGLTAGLVINTHGHFDHIGADDEFGVPVYIHRLDAPMLKNPARNFSILSASSLSVKSQVRTVNDQDLISLDEIALEVIHLPGHTAGGIALLMKRPQEGILFTGDSLFCQGIGRSDLGGDEDALLKGIRQRLLVLPDETRIYPGHGPASTIGREKSNNPFL